MRFSPFSRCMKCRRWFYYFWNCPEETQVCPFCEVIALRRRLEDTKLNVKTFKKLLEQCEEAHRREIQKEERVDKYRKNHPRIDKAPDIPYQIPVQKTPQM